MIIHRCLEFLLKAKRQTYATQGDDASVIPLVSGSLRSALRKVSVGHPFRGSLHFHDEDFEHCDTFDGSVDAFLHGTEGIRQSGRTIGTLHYSGGIVR